MIVGKVRALICRKKWLLVGLVVVVAAVGVVVVVSSQGNQSAVATTKTAVVERGSIISVVSATGTINPLNSVSISSKITEQIKDVLVEDNQQVTEGQVLIVMDDSHIDAQVRQARADLQRAQANLNKLINGSRTQEIGQSRSALYRAKARMDNAKADLERYQSLYNGGGVALQQVDSARTDYEVAVADYQTAVDQLSMTQEGTRVEDIDVARAQVQQAQAVLDNALAQLNDTVIRSPIDGTVIGKPTPKGQTVSPGIANPMVLMTVADTRTMQIDVQVDETDISKVDVGQKAVFTVDAYPGRNFEGIVTSISQKATIQQNVVYYSVLVNVDNNLGLLKPTMTARVKIYTGEHNDTLLIPAAAVKEKQEGKYVTAMVNNKPRQVKVETGLSNEDSVEIISGLQAGDVIYLSVPVKTGNAPGASGTNPMRKLFGR